MIKKLLLLFIFIIVISAIAGIFYIYRQGNFSQKYLQLNISGPNKSEAGQEIEYQISYKNIGSFPLQKSKLIFYIPENSLTEDGKNIITQDLLDINPGDYKIIKIKTRLLGKEGDVKTAKAVFTYTPQKLSVKYESEATIKTIISEVPLTLNFDLPTKTEKGKRLKCSINYFSNIDYPMENLSIRLDKINGFDITSANPISLDNSEWKIKKLNKTDGGRINIVGNINADISQNLNFSVSLGMRQNGNFIILKQATSQVQIIQPMIFISQQVNGSDSYVASPGEILHYQIFFRNIGSTPFNNLSLVTKLNGQALDLNTIQTSGGQSNGNIVAWFSQQNSQLNHLDPQAQGEVNFSVKVKDDWTPSAGDSNGELITNEINLSQTTQKFSIKVNSGLSISQSAVYKSSEINNTGPMPPEVEKTTTYTITWNIKNYFSDAKNVKVRAILPKNVIPTGKISPPDEAKNFSFDSSSKQVVWTAGDILAGTGVKGDPNSISFQISLTPDTSQKGSAVDLIGPVQASGENQFTNTIILAGDKKIDTTLPDDLANAGGGIVK